MYIDYQSKLDCENLKITDDARIQEGTEVDQPLLQYVGFLGEQN